MNENQITTEEQLKKYRKFQNKEQSEYIYYNFKSFLYQFAGYLKYQSNNKNNKNIQKFSRLVNSRYKYFKIIFQSWEIDDIFGELYIRLLYFIRKCKSENILPYITHCFKYYILEWIQKLGNDYMNHCEKINDYNMDLQVDRNYKTTENIFENNDLNNIENYIIYLYYIKNLNLKQIGILLHCSPEKISNLKKIAEEKLKQI